MESGSLLHVDPIKIGNCDFPQRRAGDSHRSDLGNGGRLGCKKPPLSLDNGRFLHPHTRGLCSMGSGDWALEPLRAVTGSTLSLRCLAVIASGRPRPSLCRATSSRRPLRSVDGESP
jgi:hypothetical protein